MTTSASSVAKYILHYFQKKNSSINNLKLQKLLYYSQAWHLALNDTPLFSDRIEAWVHGPVVPSVFREYKAFRWSPIIPPAGACELDDQAAKHIDEVLSAYEGFSSWDLARLTHSESPWKAARAELAPDVPSSRPISHDSMKRYYSQL